MSAICFLKSSERMPEVHSQSVRLLLDGSVYLGKEAGWSDYERLYRQVFLVEGLRCLRPDGWLLVSQTDEYREGRVRFKTALLYCLLSEGFELLDVKIWQRKRIDFFQVPFSVVMVWKPLGGSSSRAKVKHKPYLAGVWDFQQSNKGKDAVFPPGLCDMLIESFTEPGDLILDPFAGSGNLLAAAAAVGREAIGYEIDPALIPTLEANNVEVLR